MVFVFWSGFFTFGKKSDFKVQKNRLLRLIFTYHIILKRIITRVKLCGSHKHLSTKQFYSFTHTLFFKLSLSSWIVWRSLRRYLRWFINDCGSHRTGPTGKHNSNTSQWKLQRGANICSTNPSLAILHLNQQRQIDRRISLVSIKSMYSELLEMQYNEEKTQIKRHVRPFTPLFFS